MTRSQATLTPGRHWEMLKALGDRLPKELGETGYLQDPAWFNRQVADLVKLDRQSQVARLIEALLAGDVSTSAVSELLSHIINQFESQEVEPKLFYPQGHVHNRVSEQVRLLLVAYPWLDVSNVNRLEASWNLTNYPDADGVYVDVNPIALAQHLGIDLGDDWENFGLLTEQGPLAALTRTRAKFTNYRAGQMGPDRYRLYPAAKDTLRLLAAEQQSDLLVFPGQTGKLYAGKSVLNSRWRIEHAASPAQWPWPTYTTAHSLIGNPTRLEAREHLAIDNPGDEFSWDADGRFGVSLDFGVGGDGLYLSGRFIGRSPEREVYGSASGFVGQ